MQEFISFLREYKDVLISGLCVLLIAIGLIIKRRPKTLDEFKAIVEQVCNFIPVIINDVEEPGNGFLKKCKVKNKVCEIVEKYLRRQLCDSERDYVLNKVDALIEDILSTPQKKVN